MQEFRLRRVPIGTTNLHGFDAGEPGWLGEEWDWVANVPLLYQVLAGPMADREFIASPYAGGGQTDDRSLKAYWGSLLHLLAMSFGWKYPALGLEWWVTNKRPVDDPRFALIEQTWVADGQFDQFCAWLWIKPGISMDMTWGSDSEINLRVPKSRQWFVAVEKRSSGGSPFGGWEGSGDLLHLSGHIPFLTEPNPHGIELSLDPNGEPSGTLIAPTLAGWYAYLRDCEALQRPHPSGRSWRIDVVVKPVGWLGTYRQSRDTGRWFAGPHSLHVVGNFS